MLRLKSGILSYFVWKIVVTLWYFNYLCTKSMKIKTRIWNQSGMFANCFGLEEVNLSGLDISLCTDMEKMFFSCKKLKSVDLTPLNTSNVTNMSGIFTLCESLESVNVKGLNTSNVTSMNNLFDRCYSLRSVDISCLRLTSIMPMISHQYSAIAIVFRRLCSARAIRRISSIWRMRSLV